MTQEQLAERAEITPRGLTYLERGERHPQPGTARRLADALGLTADDRTLFLQPASLTHLSNLPDEPTPFIGRGQEIEQVCALFKAPHVRLVTLTGPGGSGKTRLALRVATTLAHFHDGVFFVDLAGRADPAFVPQTIAEVLGIKEQSGQDLTDMLSDALHDKHLLLILDNFEHLLDAASVVSILLDRCPSLHILATSRIPLHLSREHEYPVHPLPVPDTARPCAPADLMRVDSVGLFLERAQAVRPDFTLTADNAAAVAHICARLEGLPLSIELAAARVKFFSPQELLQRLDQRLTLLTGGAKDRPSRQQTLRATIDWSYSLLSDEERVLFARLSVFAGGCTLEGAEAVCGCEETLDLLEAIPSLTDKSLLLHEEKDGESRFTMLETLREYAAERLAEAGQSSSMREAHARYFFQLAGNVELELVGRHQVAWMQWLDREVDNVRTALAWFIDAGRADAALQLAGNLWRYWDSRALFTEARRWLQTGLDINGGVDPTGRAYEYLGLVAWRQGDRLETRRLLEAHLEAARGRKDDMSVAAALSTLGIISAELGEHDEAVRLHEASVALRRSLGDGRFVAHSLTNLGGALIYQNRFSEAQGYLQEAIELSRQAGDTWFLGTETALLGIAKVGLGELDPALTLARQALRLHRDLGERTEVLPGLMGVMAVAAIRGEIARTARLSGVIDAQRWTSDWTKRYLHAARAAADPGEWNRQWEIGRTMSVEEGVAYALEEDA
jgi:predicted ATPase/DNA-binding XRE family transcriptional regulator